MFPIRVPPLRERAEDIPLLVWRFVAGVLAALRQADRRGAPRDDGGAAAASWPGNIRELRNAVERAMILATGPRLTIPIPSPLAVAHVSAATRLIDVQRDHIRKVLEAANWRVRGTGGAADRLGLRPTTLETRMAKLGLSRPRPS